MLAVGAVEIGERRNGQRDGLECGIGAEIEVLQLAERGRDRQIRRQFLARAQIERRQTRLLLGETQDGARHIGPLEIQLLQSDAAFQHTAHTCAADELAFTQHQLLQGSIVARCRDVLENIRKHSASHTK
jgi:hypothetical protein